MPSRLSRTAAIVLVASLTGLLLTGCASDEPPGPVIDFELFETTDMLDADSLAALDAASDDLATIHFATSTPLLARVAAGRVLLGGPTEHTPRGVCRLVTSVERSGDTLLVHSTPATVFHAFRRLHLDVTDNLGGPALAALPVPAPSGPGMARGPLTIPVSLGDDSISWPLSEGDGSATTDEDRIEANGGLTAQIKFTFNLSFDWQDLSPTQAFDALGDLLDNLDKLFDPTATLASLLHLHFSFSIDADTDAHLGVVGKASLAFDPEKTLSVVPLTPFLIGPLLFTPNVVLVAKVEGGATGDLNLDYGMRMHFAAGFSWDASMTVPSTWKTGPTFVGAPSSATVSASARARATLKLQVHLPLYGFAGPFAGLDAWGEIGAMYGHTPCWTLDAGLDAELGASIGVFGHSLAEVAYPIPVASENLASGECTPPPVPPLTTAVIDPWSHTYEGTTWSAGDPEGFTNLELMTNGNIALGSDSGSVALEVKQDGTPVWARALHDTDPTVAVPELRIEHVTPTRDAAVLVGTRDDVYVKLTGDGSLLWAAELDSGNSWPGWSAQKLVGDDTWVGGRFLADGAPAAAENAWLAALREDGTVRWAWTWGSPDYREEVRRVVPLADGALVVGNAVTYTGASRAFAMRVGSDGTIAWAKQLADCADADDVRIDTAIETGEGNFVLGGYVSGSRPAALLLRLAPDGSDSAPAWANATGITGLLGLRVTSIQQLSTGELRVAGTHWTAGDDAVFVAGTDSTGRVAWLRDYGGVGPEAVPDTFVMQDGGLLVAATTGSLAPGTGGFWLMKLPLSDGAIDFTAGSGAMSAPFAYNPSAAVCLTTPTMPTTTSPLAVSLWSKTIEARPLAPTVGTQR